MAQISQAFGDLLNDTDAIIADVLEEAKKLVAVSRNEAAELRRQIALVEKKRAMQVDSMLDPEMPKGTKQAVYRELAIGETKLKELQQALERLGDEANDNTERLAEAVRQAIDDAKADFSGLASPADMHTFIGRFVGPMVVGADGTIARKQDQTKTPPAGAEGVNGGIAGGGFEPPTSGL